MFFIMSYDICGAKFAKSLKIFCVDLVPLGRAKSNAVLVSNFCSNVGCLDLIRSHPDSAEHPLDKPLSAIAKQDVAKNLGGTVSFHTV